MGPRLPDGELLRWLQEDAPHGDLTSRALGLQGQPAQLVFAARGGMRVALIEEAARLFELAGALCGTGELRVSLHCRSGQQAAAGAPLLSVQGPVAPLLLGWKVAQTAVEIASGMASAAAAIIAALQAEGHRIPLACTRKTWPGGRALAARAVQAGGAVMHRLGLSETLLVFPEHRAFIDPAQWPQRLAELARQQPEKKRVVEVGDDASAWAAARAGAELLQLERYSPQRLAALKSALAAQGLRPLIAPAGGVTLANALDYARAGADLLVSSAPYLAPPCDVQVTVEPAELGASVMPSRDLDS